jgi:hypothetical protein
LGTWPWRAMLTRPLRTVCSNMVVRESDETAARVQDSNSYYFALIP